MNENTLTAQDEFYASKLVFRKVGEFYLAIDPEVPNLISVGEKGRRILDFIREGGKFQYGAVVERACANTSLTQSHVEKFLQALYRSKFLRANPLPTPKEEIPFTELNTLHLELTQACNLRCKHCYYSAGHPAEEELESTEIFKVLREFKDLGGKDLFLTGGEPLLRRDKLFEIIKEADKLGINIYLETNATLMKESDAQKFEEYDVFTSISLDGATAKTHDFIRGEGNFQKAVKGLKVLRRHGVDTGIGFTLMGTNKTEVEKVFRLARELGVKTVDINRLVIGGRAEKYETTLKISKADTIESLKRSIEISKELGVQLSIFEDLMERFSSRTISCDAGIRVLAISANGTVYPCRPAQGIAFFKAGNVRASSLKTIWRNSSALQKIRQTTVLDSPNCTNCELKYICGGGCPVTRYRDHGKIDAKPACQIYKEMSWYRLREIGRKMWKEASPSLD